jgi:hypothetical protein
MPAERWTAAEQAAPGEETLLAAGPPVPPDTFDEVVQDELPDELEADFAPLSYDGRAARGKVDPFQLDSIEAQKAFDTAVALAAEGQEQEAIEQYIRAAKIAETAREWHLAAVACQRVGDFLSHPKPPFDLERAFRMYRRAVAAYEQCGLFAEARELAFRILYTRMRRAKELRLPLAHRIELRLFWLLAGFGYRPGQVILTAAVLILSFGLVYWLSHGVVSTHGPGPTDLWHALYFSGIVFTTVGFGDYLPAPHMRVVAFAEGFLGVFTMGLFVATLAARLSRT